jgi:O-antigen/teichoic acid export membrane protein
VIAALRKLLPKNSFARNVSVLVGGTAGAQALMLLAAPLLTRLYTPEDFGLLAVYAGLLALFSVVASLRYELAIPLPESNTEAANVLVLSLLVVLAMGGISSVMVVLAGDQIVQALGSPALAKYFWLLPIGVLLAGSYKVFNYWAVRTKSFGDIATTRVSQTLATLAIQIFGFKLGGTALLFGQAGGQGIGSIRLARLALKHREFKSWSWSGVWQAAKRYRGFPIFSTWSALLNTIGTQLPLILFSVLFSPSVAGAYLLTQRVLGAPITLISDAVSKVFLAHATKALRRGDLNKLILRIHKKLANTIIPVFLVFSFFSPTIFSFFFGEEWLISGEIARWISAWLAFVFILSPFMVLFEVLEHQKIGVLFQFIMVILRIFAIIVGFRFDSFMLSIKLFTVFSVVSLIAFNIWLSFKTNASFLAMLKNYIYSFLGGVFIMTPIGFMYLAGNSLDGMLIGGAVSLIFVFLYVFNSFVSEDFTFN